MRIENYTMQMENYRIPEKLYNSNENYTIPMKIPALQITLQKDIDQVLQRLTCLNPVPKE